MMRIGVSLCVRKQADREPVPELAARPVLPRNLGGGQSAGVHRAFDDGLEAIELIHVRVLWRSGACRARPTADGRIAREDVGVDLVGAAAAALAVGADGAVELEELAGRVDAVYGAQP
jgi:hypothetical protein